MKLIHQNNPHIQLQSRNTLDFPQHIHEVLELVFLHRGSATAICGSRRYRLAAGDVFISFPNQPHGYEESREVTCDVFIVPVAYLPHWRSQLTGCLPENPVLQRGSWEKTGIGQLLALMRPERQQLTDAVKQGYAMVIAGKLMPLLHLTPREAGADNTLQRLLEYLSEHYREPLTRKDLAQSAGYNESYISHIFAAQLGTTLTDYLTSLRLRDARELLAETDLTVSRISLMLGFGSIRSFNRAFAAHTGCSPTAYRIDNRQNPL